MRRGTFKAGLLLWLWGGEGGYFAFTAPRCQGENEKHKMWGSNPAGGGS